MTDSMANAIALLRDAYPRQQFPDRSVALYGAALADLDDTEVAAAIKRLIRRETWLPSIADIRREVAVERVGEPDPEEAWAQVSRAIDDGGYGLRIQSLAAQAVADLGGAFTLRQMKAGMARRAFLDAYTARLNREIQREMGSLPPSRAHRQQMLTNTTALPQTTRIRPRPVMARLTRRWAGRTIGPPTNEEKADAILILREGPADGIDPMYEEAQRVLCDADAEISVALLATTD